MPIRRRVLLARLSEVLRAPAQQYGVLAREARIQPQARQEGKPSPQDGRMDGRSGVGVSGVGEGNGIRDTPGASPKAPFVGNVGLGAAAPATSVRDRSCSPLAHLERMLAKLGAVRPTGVRVVSVPGESDHHVRRGEAREGESSGSLERPHGAARRMFDSPCRSRWLWRLRQQV